MAKTRRRIKSPGQGTPFVSDSRRVAGPESMVGGSWAPRGHAAATGLLGGMMVYVAYYPSDSIQVEQGDALWLAAIAIVLWTLALATRTLLQRMIQIDAIDVVAWSLALWMAFAAWASCPPNNLRLATNEAWLWVTGAAVLTAARRLLASSAARRGMIVLFAAIATAMAFHALYQEWITLPQTRAEYLADPDGVLRQAGVDAPAGSSRRMVFANRLLDGGPTARFALANSLAAMLLSAVLIPLGILLSAWHRDRRSWPLVVPAGLLMTAGLAAMFATRSRSVIGAALLGGVWIGVAIGRLNASRGGVAKRLIIATTAGSVLIGMIVLGLALFGDREWIAAAIPSLTFRLRYWESTLAMLFDHPFLGAGPGGFQAMYLRYRMPVASETISDPHNWFFETLASGGLVGGGLLLALVLLCLRFRWKSTNNENGEPQPIDSSATVHLLGGAVISLSLIWLFALATGSLPDAGAAILSLPFAAVAGVTAYFGLNKFAAHSRCFADGMIVAVMQGLLLAVLTHLAFSGGWTVPGVAILVWLTAAALTARRETDTGDSAPESRRELMNPRQAKRTSLAIASIGLLLLAWLNFGSIVPVQDAGLGLISASDAASRGSGRRAVASAEQAAAADPWNFETVLWQSEYWTLQLTGSPEGDPVMKERWKSAADLAIDRAGENPLVYRAAGQQALHLYQRFGDQADLNQADQWITRALELSPTDVALAGQAALIAAERSDQKRANRLAVRARRLSKLGSNITRDLGLKFVYVVRPLGRPSANRPRMASIKDEFRDSDVISAEPAEAVDRSANNGN